MQSASRGIGPVSRCKEALRVCAANFVNLVYNLIIPVTNLSHSLGISTLCSFLTNCHLMWARFLLNALNNEEITFSHSFGLNKPFVSSYKPSSSNGPTTSISTMIVLETMRCQYQFLQLFVFNLLIC